MTTTKHSWIDLAGFGGTFALVDGFAQTPRIELSYSQNRVFTIDKELNHDKHL